MERIKNSVLASRPWSFSMSVISVAIGALWAVDSGISWPLLAATLACMVSLHGATNLLNDYFDVRNRVDVPGAPTVIYRPHPLAHAELGLTQTLVTALVLYAVGCGIGLWLATTRGWALLVIGLIGATISVLYTATRFAIKYHALGEVAVFLVWGPLAVLGSYYVQARSFSWDLLLVSIPFGILVGLVLLANNIRDISYDRRQGISTLPVRLGLVSGRLVFVALVALAFASMAVMAVFGPLGLWSLIVLISLPLGLKLCKMIYGGVPADADAQTAKLDTVFGVLLIASLLLERMV